MFIVGIVGAFLLLLALNVLVSVVQETKGPLSWRLKGGAIALVGAIVLIDVAIWLWHT